MSRQANKRSRGDTTIVVYGRRAVLEAIDAPTTDVLDVRVATEVPSDFRKKLTEACRRIDVTVERTDRDGVRALSKDFRHDQGVAARIRLKNVIDIDAFGDTLTGRAARERTSVMVLDAITNPQNIGMIIRSTVASGMSGIVWPMAACPWINGLVIKASAGTLYQSTIIRAETIEDALHALRGAGFHVHGLDAEPAAANLFEFEPPHRGAYVLGAETTGLTDDARALLDGTIRIPMAAGVESLNVAVSAALLGYRVGSV